VKVKLLFWQAQYSSFCRTDVAFAGGAGGVGAQDI